MPMNADPVRIGVIGIGNMGNAHARKLEGGEIRGATLGAVCDRSEARLASFPSVPRYTTAEELFAARCVDAVLVATPHFSHTSYGIAALEQGYHLLIEKPISVQKADCERLIAAHKDPSLVFAAMFNQRTDPRYLELKKMISSGKLGAIHRINWTITDWFRSNQYYGSGGWRATWAGEGGGVLLNQCPHQLDLWHWLFGRPHQVRAFCQMGRFHDIEVEDNVTAYMEYEDGKSGVFITTTGEAPGTNRLEIAADNGRVVIESSSDRISFIQNQIPTSEFTKTSKSAFDRPPVWNIEIPINGSGGQHAEIMENFVAAIRGEAELIAPAAEGIYSVELANAMLLSSARGQTLELPLSSRDYEAFLNERISASSYNEAEDVPDQGVAADFNKSF
jgi:predicted dehydrogenase